MGAVEQMELYQSITDVERLTVKNLLERYPKMRRTIQELAKKEELNEKQRQLYTEWGNIVDEIDTAFGLILDDEVKRIFEHRYLKGQKYLSTINLFWSEHRSERTIDRRIGVGVDTIAEHLKLCGII
ncbi:hypothetical protein MUG84_26600 [Paenibacillus sp. KQZ6P-2]|uniref:Uncharacterized protein n=1 Tax=Paenibacillus mangrovi TaxID=2931978 RepID=A0A9X2B950_9BACL|nr:hypothetical protein [Paenibacillus mangrovi]MCJ8015243.1 hypothetical protein [Paenibacillus mangrovi]